MGVSGVVGPLFGGFIVDQVSWHFIFFINVPFGLASIYLIAKHYKEQLEAVKRKIDYLGAVFLQLAWLRYCLLLSKTVKHKPGYQVNRR